MGREIRRVPANWEHPKKTLSDGRVCYIPLFDGSGFQKKLKRWIKENAQWEDGTHESLIEDPSRKLRCPQFSDWDGHRPDPADYMPDWPKNERTHYQLYETCTEGTPVSPVLASFDEVVAYAAKHCTTFGMCTATEEQWRRMLKAGHVYARIGNGIFG